MTVVAVSGALIVFTIYPRYTYIRTQNCQTRYVHDWGYGHWGYLNKPALKVLASCSSISEDFYGINNL